MSEIQKRILEIFLEIKKLCDKYNVPYFAVGGTCLGAIRHKGFIPWDDDMDIAIPIEHYENFLEICEKNLPNYLSVYRPENNSHYCNVFCKIVDKRTAFIDRTVENHPDSYWGVFVDIMPMSGLPSGSLKKRIFIFQLRILLSMNSFKKKTLSDYTTVAGRRKFKMANIVTKRFQQNWFVDEYYKLMEKYPLSTSNYVGYTWSKNLKNLVFDQKLFSSTIDVPFESTMMKCPVGYDDYLSAMFGNYMKFPPENERNSGHEGIVDLSNSYICYQNYYEEKGETPWIKK